MSSPDRTPVISLVANVVTTGRAARILSDRVGEAVAAGHLPTLLLGEVSAASAAHAAARASLAAALEADIHAHTTDAHTTGAPAMKSTDLTPDLQARLARHDAARDERERIAAERLAVRLGELATAAVVAEAESIRTARVVMSLPLTEADRGVVEKARRVSSDAHAAARAARTALRQTIMDAAERRARA